MRVKLPSPRPPASVTANIPGLRDIKRIPELYSKPRRLACWFFWRMPIMRSITKWLVGKQYSPYGYFIVVIDPKYQEQAKEYLAKWEADNLSPTANKPE